MTNTTRIAMVCGVLAACGGGGGGGGYDKTMNRLMTAETVPQIDDTILGEWTDASTSQVAYVTKDGDTYRIAVVSGSPSLPPLSSLEGGKVEPKKHDLAHGLLEAWQNGTDVPAGTVYLLSGFGGPFRESHEVGTCDASRGFGLDLKKDKAGKPVFWISMYNGPGEGFPRTYYFQKSADHVDAATAAKIQDAATHCPPAEEAPPEETVDAPTEE